MRRTNSSKIPRINCVFPSSENEDHAGADKGPSEVPTEVSISFDESHRHPLAGGGYGSGKAGGPAADHEHVGRSLDVELPCVCAHAVVLSLQRPPGVSSG